MATDNKQTDSTEYKGWLFPAGIEPPPDEMWYTMEFRGGQRVHDITKDGALYCLRSAGLLSLETDIRHTGQDPHGEMWAVGQAQVIVEYEGMDRDESTFQAIGSADTMSDQVNDPEFLWSVAATRAIKRVAKHALGIRPATDETAEASDKEAGDTDTSSSVPDSAPDSVDSMPSDNIGSSSGPGESGEW
jgi:hypothetical protein